MKETHKSTDQTSKIHQPQESVVDTLSTGAKVLPRVTNGVITQDGLDNSDLRMLLSIATEQAKRKD